MNGRCQKDALDRAEDICELCGDQFCASCLLFPRGRRNPPTCKTCALEHSGLRGGSKLQVISKREYKKRKKQLLAELEDFAERQPPIEFFELNDPSEFDHSNELDRRSAVVEEEPTIDILAASDDPPAPTPPAPTTTPAPPTAAPAPQPPAPQPPAPAPVPAAADQGSSGFEPVDTSVNPLALGGSPAPTAEATASDASSSAAELLARLKADQPIQSQFTADSAELDTDPFAAPTSDLVTPEQSVSSAPAQREAAQFDEAPRTSAPQEPRTKPAVAAPKTEPWSPPTPPPRGSNLSAMSSDATSVESQAPAPQAPLQESPFEAPSFDEQPSQEAPTVEDSPTRRKADTDNSGQWIPPSLRGMAAPDERVPLPKRRS